MHLRCREGESPSQCASRGAGLWVWVFAGQIVPVCPRLASFWLRKSQVPGNPHLSQSQAGYQNKILGPFLGVNSCHGRVCSYQQTLPYLVWILAPLIQHQEACTY